MVDQDKKIPFPQANDFEKIVRILDTDEMHLSDKSYLQEAIDVTTDRQVQYYISACQFLGLINRQGNFTEIALKIKKSCYENKILSLSRLIISTPVFGEVFFKKYIYKEDTSIDEIAQLIRDLWDSNDSFSVCQRRSSTVKKWLEWVDSNRE